MDFYFRKRDQAAVAIVLLLIIGLVFVRTHYRNQGAPTVNYDRASQLEYRFTIDTNQSAWHELALVPGIGRALAQRIVDYRTEHGAFQTSEQLLEVDGIGPRKLETLQEFLPTPPTGLTPRSNPSESGPVIGDSSSQKIIAKEVAKNG